MAQIIDFVTDGDISRFFREEKRKVVRYLIRQYKLREAEAEDCFQEGCIAVWKNIESGKLTKENLTGSLSSYLTRCCCNHATHELEKKKKMVDGDDIFLTHLINEDSGDQDEQSIIDDEQLQLVESAVKTLPEPCYTILWNVYFNYHEIEKTLKDKETVMGTIALMIGYKKTSLKAKKSQCLTKLKTKINSLIN